MKEEQSNKQELPWQDKKRFEQFYKDHFLTMVVFCEHVVKDKDLACQLVQEAFFKIWEKRTKLQEIKNPEAYLYVAVKNVALDYLRKFQHELFVLPEEQVDEEATFPWSEDESLMPLIKKLTKQLPDKCREVFELSYFQGLTKDEIAEYLKISPETVKKQRTIALKKMRSALSPYVKSLLILISFLG
ncbi:RNA polymerase sigma-70 factor [Rapidithrix thailandica]|uniref:RNA polymerase sigma-70 factor n=1 Tax=Rapidithrix thailandica TaxID=413964 RepID=A0AAW9SCF0_9BACT